MSKEKLIPELRFPEFLNEGEWEEMILDDIGSVVASGDLDSNSFSAEQTDVHIYPVYSNSVTNEGLYGFNTYSKFKINSVTITARGTLGVAFVRKSEFVGIGRLLVVSELNNTDAVFLKENWNHFAKVPLENGGIPQLTAVKAKLVKLLFPKLTEQQKIASCLSSLDELIAAHSQKLDLLKHHKKGLMQNLFPQEGEKVPKYRFKEFEKDGEWVEKKLGEVAEIITGSTPSTNEPLFYGGNKMFVSPADISDKRIISQTKTTLTELGFSKTRQIKAGSVLFVCIGSTIGKIAQNQFDCATNQQLNSLIANNDYSNDFLYSILDANSAVIASIAGNHAVPIINKTSFSEVKLFFPPSFQEQQKIASCLSSLDDLITAQTEKIEQLKLHKKGLMQGLFPKLND